MGFFKRRNKRKEEAANNESAVLADVTITYEEDDEEEGELYYPKVLCPEINRYTVVGTNPKTKRKNTKTAIVLEPVSVSVLEKKTGLVDIVSYEKETPYPPSDKQLAYAADLLIMIPEGSNGWEVSDMITSRTSGSVQRPVSPYLAVKMAEKDIRVSRYCGEKRALNLLWYSMGLEERAVFFVCSIYGRKIGRQQYDFESWDQYGRLKDLAMQLLKNDSFVRSLAKVEYNDISLFESPNKRRVAVQLALENV